MSEATPLRVRILGCGSSGGVPRIGGPQGAGDWGVCDPHEPRNRRTRCSLLVERRTALGAATTVLVDASPDLRSQLLEARCARVDAVLFTHDHADQSHGIDDLRVLAILQRQRIPVYIDDATSGEITSRFRYCFEQAPGSLYRPILMRKTMPPPGSPFDLDGPGGAVPCVAFLQNHGDLDSLGFRFGDCAYSSDVVALSEESFRILAGVRIWIVDALQPMPHKTHAHLALTLEWIARVRPQRAILTNLHNSMDYAALKASLPQGVEPAYDGLEIEALAG